MLIFNLDKRKVSPMMASLYASVGDKAFHASFHPLSLPKLRSSTFVWVQVLAHVPFRSGMTRPVCAVHRALRSLQHIHTLATTCQIRRLTIGQRRCIANIMIAVANKLK